MFIMPATALKIAFHSILPLWKGVTHFGNPGLYTVIIIAQSKEVVQTTWRYLRRYLLVAGLFLVGLTGKLVQTAAGESAAFPVAVITALATPVFFYSFTFWEITLAAALPLVGIYLAFRIGPSSSAGKTLAAGAVLGTAIFFRTELMQ